MPWVVEEAHNKGPEPVVVVFELEQVHTAGRQVGEVKGVECKGAM